MPTARATPHVRLVPMTDEERDAALRGQVSGYADAKTRAGIWPAEESLARAQAEIVALLGPRPRDRGHEFFVARDGEGRRVGWLWLGPVPSTEASPNARWVFQIEVDERLRGRGFGRGLLRAAEDRVRGSGYEEIALNVFR